MNYSESDRPNIELAFDCARIIKAYPKGVAIGLRSDYDSPAAIERQKKFINSMMELELKYPGPMYDWNTAIKIKERELERVEERVHGKVPF